MWQARLCSWQILKHFLELFVSCSFRLFRKLNNYPRRLQNVTGEVVDLSENMPVDVLVHYKAIIILIPSAIVTSLYCTCRPLRVRDYAAKKVYVVHRSINGGLSYAAPIAKCETNFKNIISNDPQESDSTLRLHFSRMPRKNTAVLSSNHFGDRYITLNKTTVM